MREAQGPELLDMATFCDPAANGQPLRDENSSHRERWSQPTNKRSIKKDKSFASSPVSSPPYWRRSRLTQTSAAL